MRVHRLTLNATALRQSRYGQGTTRQNVSLLTGTWERLDQYAPEDGGHKSALIELALVTLEALLHPLSANMSAAVGMLTIGLGNESVALMAISGNLRELAMRVEQAAMEADPVADMESDDA